MLTGKFYSAHCPSKVETSNRAHHHGRDNDLIGAHSIQKQGKRMSLVLRGFEAHIIVFLAFLSNKTDQVTFLNRGAASAVDEVSDDY